MSALTARIERLKAGHNDGERPIAASALDLLAECQSEMARLEAELARVNKERAIDWQEYE